MVVVANQRVKIVKKRTRKFTRHQCDRYKKIKVGLSYSFEGNQAREKALVPGHHCIIDRRSHR